MTDKELRRLKRAELLEILYYLQRENEELKEELGQLKERTLQNAGGGLPEDFMEQIKQTIRETAANQPGRKKRR